MDDGLDTLIITDEDDDAKWATNLTVRSMSMVLKAESTLPVSGAEESGLETVDIEDGDSGKTWATKIHIRSEHLVLVSSESG